MSRIAFIGIGTMGLPMARNLVAAGHEVIACDIVPERAAALGSEIACTPAEAAAGAEVAITSLPSPRAVEDAVLGADGVRVGAGKGGAVIEMSTSPPALMRRLAAELEADGIEFLDAPVSGGPTGAEAATLAIMVGGKATVFERWRRLLEALGSRVEHVGGPGAGQTVKLCNNLIVACTMAGMAEGCAIAENEGIDPTQAFDVFTSSSSDSSVMRRRFPVPGVRPEHPASDGYRPMFRLDLLLKDLALALELAAEVGVSASVAEASSRLYREALQAGLGELDYSAVYLALRPRDS